MIIDGYRITAIYPSIVEGVNLKNPADKKYFQYAYIFLSEEQRKAQNEYWEQVESEYREAEILWRERSRQRWYK